MSNGPDQAPASANRCPNGHDNPPDRIFCDECGNRILVAQAPPDRSDAAGPEEEMRLQRELSPEREAHRDLQDTFTLEIDARHASENKVVSDADDIPGKLAATEKHAAALQSQLLDVQEKWKSAEEKNSLLERHLTENAKQHEGRPVQHTRSLKMIVGTLAVAGVLLGYGVGHRVSQSKNQHVITPIKENMGNEQNVATQLRATLTQDQDQINNLNSQLDAANQTVTKLNDEVAKGRNKEAVIQKKLEQTLGELKTERDQNTVAVNQLRDQLQSKTQETTRLRQQTNDIAAELAALQKKHPSWNYAGAPEGTFRWQGELKEKSANIVIDQTGVHASNAKSTSSQGNLPLAPFGWKQVVVNTDGKGKVTAQLVWSVF
jgi:predicted  nucleic acid-binding Zn-ribbon protein